MNIPKYWAYKKTEEKPSITKWGWSNVSQEDAENQALKRIKEYKQGTPKKELVSEYFSNGEIPIREEVIENHSFGVVTRNSYGALCLNSEKVLISDIDFNEELEKKEYIISFSLFILCFSFLYFFFFSFS